MAGAATPFKFNSFSINPSILKEWVDEKNEFDWAAAYNAHFTMFNFMNFTFVSLIPQKKNSIIKHSSIPVINYCYNIFSLHPFHQNNWRNEQSEKKRFIFCLSEVNGVDWLMKSGLLHKINFINFNYGVIGYELLTPLQSINSPSLHFHPSLIKERQTNSLLACWLGSLSP